MSYAKKGIEHAQEALKYFSRLNYSIIPNLMSTYSYSQLALLTTSKEEQNRYSKDMLDFAHQAEKMGTKLEGGVLKAFCYNALYRAYKTLGDIAEDKESKIIMLSSAAEASRKYIESPMEIASSNLMFQMRLGLLYEEISHLTGKMEALIQAKELYSSVVKESKERRYDYYAAAATEYIARLEDRLGNYSASAEYYKKALEYHEESLKLVKYKPRRIQINEKMDYAKSWTLIERAKNYHKVEKHQQAKESYKKACEILKNLPSYNYESIYYSAWILLEEAEDLSKKEMHEEAIHAYKTTMETFGNTSETLKEVFIKTRDRVEREKISKLEKLIKIRIKHCSARVNVEEARILGRQGEHLAAAEKFALAASEFKEVCNRFKIEKEREELEGGYYLCRAWESMEFAETYGDSNRFAEAAGLFSKASNLFSSSKMKLLSSGNSAFCQALEYGCQFDETTDTKLKAELYPKVKTILRKAASSYRKGGFENGADWALATSTYFDAAWHLIRADEELNLDEKRRLLELGSKILDSASELFAKSGYKEKEREILDQLDMVKKEEKIIISALNTITEPSIARSTIGIIAPACPHESSRSTRISEVREFGDEIAKAEIKEPSREKYQLIYKDLLKEYPENQQKEFRVGIAQIGLSSTDNILDEFYMDDGSGLLHLREDKVDTISEKVKDVINNAQKNDINILIFPEMSIDLTYGRLIEEISNLAKKFNMYIIPGSYHESSTRRNLCLVISPDGVLWEQEKSIPAMINFKGTRFKEGIESGRFPRKITICNTEYGRIAIAICRDFLDMDLRVELKNFEPPVDLIINPAFTPVTADFKAAHFDARRSIYAYCFFANIGEYGNSLIYTPEKERIERTLPPKEEGLIFKDIDLFKLRSERKKWQKIHEKEKKFIQSTR
jgi:predicted amidohydrolase